MERVKAFDLVSIQREDGKTIRALGGLAKRWRDGEVREEKRRTFCHEVALNVFE